MAKPSKNEKTLRAIRPNVGVEIWYRRALVRLIDRMAANVASFVKRAYKAHPPMALAMDKSPIEGKESIGPGGKVRWHAYVNGEPLKNKNGVIRSFTSQQAAVRAAKIELGEYLPADELQDAMDEMAARWQGEFDRLAPVMAKLFATKNSKNFDTAMMSALKKVGFAVEFAPTLAQQDVLNATIKANVQLIKSIPQKYLGEVQGAVMRSVMAGRDLESLSSFIREQYGVTKRRAELIARDQNNKATSAMTEARRKEIGVKKAIWMHSGAGKEPRPKHVAASGKVYNVDEGLPIGDKGEWVFPGEEINCRCTSKSILPWGTP